MLHWIPFAFVRIVVFFAAGIVLGIYYPDLIPPFYAEAFFAFLLLLYLAFFILSRKTALKINPGFVGLLAILTAGYLNVLRTTDSRRSDHLAKLDQPVEYYRVVIDGYAEEKEHAWKQVASVSAVRVGKTWQPARGNVLLYFSKQDFDASYHYGDVLLLRGGYHTVQGPANPGEFDYKQFLAFRNISHQQFLKKEDVIFITHAPSVNFIKKAGAIRDWAEIKLEEVIRGKKEHAIACALVLGIRDGLDNELVGAYAASGAMHVLAVSGLHVGILYAIVFWLLKPLRRNAAGHWLAAGISLLVLWCYACVTGLSPSVLRAVTMFSFVAIAQPLNYRTNIYNTLAASAFCLLCFNPYLLMSVGFQLSYLAVLGIVYIQPVLYAMVEFKSRFWDQVWKISCVSLAAQLATFALGLLYFHQFPSYFLIANVFVIPLAFAILSMGLTVLTFSFIQPVIDVLGVVLSSLIKLLNFVVLSIESLPFSKLEGVYISPFQCWMLILAIVAISVFLQHRKLLYMYAAAVTIGLFSMESWNHFHSEVKQQKITVYKVAGFSALDLFDNGKTYFFGDTALKEDSKKVNFHIMPNRLRSGIDEVYRGAQQPFIKRFEGGQLMVWNGKRILQIDQRKFMLPERIQVDYLILSRNTVLDLSDVLLHVVPGQVVVDSSNAMWMVDKVLADIPAERRALVHSVWHQGAFEKNI